MTQIAVGVGLDRARFSSCLADSERFEDRVNQDTQNAIDSGGQGTPYTVVIDKDENKNPVSGAVPFQNIKEAVDEALGL